MFDTSDYPGELDPSDHKPKSRPEDVALKWLQIEFEAIARENGHTEAPKLAEVGLSLFRTSKDAMIEMRLGKVINQWIPRSGKNLSNFALLATETLGDGFAFKTVGNLCRLSKLFDVDEVRGVGIAHLKVLINAKMPDAVRQAGLAAARNGASVEELQSLVLWHKGETPW